MAQGRGGARKGAGRPKGSRSAATIEQQATISELARAHGSIAIEALAYIATKGESESARVSAANALLDRGYGKSVQAMDHTSSDGTMSPQPPETIDKALAEALAKKLTE